jgi:hypothetical protein
MDAVIVVVGDVITDVVITSMERTEKYSHLVGSELKEGDCFIFSRILGLRPDEGRFYFSNVAHFPDWSKSRDVLERDAPPDSD